MQALLTRFALLGGPIFALRLLITTVDKEGLPKQKAMDGAWGSISIAGPTPTSTPVQPARGCPGSAAAR